MAIGHKGVEKIRRGGIEVDEGDIASQVIEPGVEDSLLWDQIEAPRSTNPIEGRSILFGFNLTVEGKLGA